MSFWSGEKLINELPHLIQGYRAENIDCASYRLTVGEQAFVTSENLNSSSPHADLVTFLEGPPRHMLRIAPGQFAFILTEEIVSVPAEAIAFISMRAKYKFKGLINVSGFHVDPGWKGKLLFSIYNAGPQQVVVRRGDPIFLIVYADLDRTSGKLYNGASQSQDSINPDLLDKLTGQVFSPHILSKKLEGLDQKVSSYERSMGIVQAVTAGLGVFLGLLLALAALFATMLPEAPGVIIAETLKKAGYEINKSADADVTKPRADLLQAKSNAQNAAANALIPPAAATGAGLHGAVVR